jgi:hypothetical protein
MAVDNKLLTVLVCVLALFAGFFLMRWLQGGKARSRKSQRK